MLLATIGATTITGWQADQRQRMRDKKQGLKFREPQARQLLRFIQREKVSGTVTNHLTPHNVVTHAMNE
jgi:hypothetical protein